MTKLTLLVLAYLIVTVLSDNSPSARLHEDAGLNIFELIEKYGYTYERHSLVTEDGYILETHRIPKEGGIPVFLMHGVLSSSTDWCNFGEKSLAFILSDLGYDVWLGNARGNTWGRNHTTLDPDENKPEFWSFSWHEIGKYDLATNIDHILETTGHEQLFYIGHSQGSTVYFVLTSERPEYNDKIRLMQALGPPVYMDNMFNPFFQLLAKFEQSIEWITQYIGMYEFLPHSELIELLGRTVCEENAPHAELCSNIFFLICGFDSEQLETYMFPIISTNAPAGCATKQFLHYAQSVNAGDFRQFDFHSEEENLEHYGQTTPPKYDISKITSPIALHFGPNDWLVSEIDVDRLASQLPNLVIKNKIAYDRFNHIDYIWAKDVVELLYNDVIALLEKY